MVRGVPYYIARAHNNRALSKVGAEDWALDASLRHTAL
jgi:hypothetical protein